MTFGEKLTVARKEKNLSQDELAQKLYVTRQAVSRWENNSTQPSLEMLAVICLELEKTPNDFIDTPQKNSTRFYKSLSFGEKWDYALEFSGENKLVGFLVFVFNVIADIGIGLTVYFAATQSIHEYPPFLLASVLSGTTLLAVSGITLLILTFINNSKKFSRWLSNRNRLFANVNEIAIHFIVTFRNGGTFASVIVQTYNSESRLFMFLTSGLIMSPTSMPDFI